MIIKIIEPEIFAQCTDSLPLSGVVGAIAVVCAGLCALKILTSGRAIGTSGTEPSSSRDVVAGSDLDFAVGHLQSLVKYNTEMGPTFRANLRFKYENLEDVSRDDLAKYDYILSKSGFSDRDELPNISRTLCANSEELANTVLGAMTQVVSSQTSGHYELVSTFGRYLASFSPIDLDTIRLLVTLHEQSTLLLTTPLLCKVAGCLLFFKFFTSLHKKSAFVMFMGASLNLAFYFRQWGLHRVRDIVLSPAFLLTTLPTTALGVAIARADYSTAVSQLRTIGAREFNKLFSNLENMWGGYGGQFSRDLVVKGGYRGVIFTLEQMLEFLKQGSESYDREIRSRGLGPDSSETAIVPHEQGPDSSETAIVPHEQGPDSFEW